MTESDGTKVGWKGVSSKCQASSAQDKGKQGGMWEMSFVGASQEAQMYRWDGRAGVAT